MVGGGGSWGTLVWAGSLARAERLAPTPVGGYDGGGGGSWGTRLTVPQTSGVRFYRVLWTSKVNVAGISLLGGNVVLSYQ